jgi:SAM-dependent methyltransferase
MEAMRRPFQGVTNIVRFNWHYYAVAIILSVTLLIFYNSFLPIFQFITRIFVIVLLTTTAISLLVSAYIYDLSGIYKLSWIDKFISSGNQIVNINAGLDETSSILKKKYEKANLTVFDFYDSRRHTEVSIARARRLYLPYPGTKQIDTSHIPLQNNSADNIFNILSVHEIRDDEERNNFFKELSRVLSDNGKIFITEHLRDSYNFLAYNIGAFHFLSRKSWLRSFEAGGLTVAAEFKITPFITTFVLVKNGNPS